MNALNRRNWIKRSALAVGAITMTPTDIWASKVEAAQLQKRKFLFDNDALFNEFTPPKFPDLSTVKARLVWNENPYGPSNKAQEAFAKAVVEGNHYSWGSLNKLVTKICKNENVKPSQIMMGPGSSDLLEKVAMVYFQNGGNIISADPSYMSLVAVAEASGGTWKPIKLTDDYQHDLDAMEAAIDADTKLVYITNPNNPTATLTNPKKLENFCKRVSKKVPIFIDEAYIELSEAGMKNSMVHLVEKGHDVMVARTFSKIHGMAGLRVGYMAASENIINKIGEITRGGMGITGPSIAAANASLDDAEYLDMCKTELTKARIDTMAYLKSKGIDYMPSQTNFVIFPIDMEGDVFLEKVYAKKIVVRAFNFWDQNWCRVSMGKPKEMQYFFEAMDEILA
ncbi:histidinol-phosphate aminotransferase [Pustulibacterium marinum]|uniref:Histidinol-phosphate aminotransferase n=1 Tax=Pustulibacterium marinum TaxID=1224947 RepID=A0A1I7FTN9_9FLAO|nr:histidinol-phosphate transaminase [Pustulibacterium marinum]SFU39520.1 histidinol-phosphate aminotransferase [Pustulibacterium marinum]